MVRDLLIQGKERSSIVQRDPVCGMSVDANDVEETSTYQGKTYYFCSPECKTKFDQRPSQFIGSKPQQPSV
jgi:Cu+-exporting ATPase